MARSQLSAIGSLLADDTRAEILTLLMDGRAHTGSEPARHTGVSPSTASEHLSKLLDAGMVAVETQGRHRYFRLASNEIAGLLETVGATPTLPSVSRLSAPAALAFARTRYDHLAGELDLIEGATPVRQPPRLSRSVAGFRGIRPARCARPNRARRAATQFSFDDRPLLPGRRLRARVTASTSSVSQSSMPTVSIGRSPKRATASRQ